MLRAWLTSAALVLVAAVVTAPAASAEEPAEATRPSFPHVVNGWLLFGAHDGVHGWELWRTDGTRAGTRLLKDINARPGFFRGDSDASMLAELGDLLLLEATDKAHGCELWRTDGTRRGTKLVKDIQPILGCFIAESIPYEDGVLFTTGDGVHGLELWSSDGTEAGTRLVKDIHAGAGGLGLFSTFTRLDQRVLFAADDGIHGRELWITDGTEAGTRLVKDIRSGPKGARPTYQGYSGRLGIVLNGRLVFIADDGVHGREMWSSDGSEEGTVRLAKMRPPGESRPFQEPCTLSTPSGELLLFTGPDEDGGDALWRTDGTDAGTKMVDARVPWFLCRYPDGTWGPVGWDGVALLSARDSPDSQEWRWWRTDGTPEGTYLLDGVSGSSSSVQLDHDTVLFWDDDLDLWVTDGTAHGTRLLKDIDPKGCSDESRYWVVLAVIAGVAYLNVCDAVHGPQLWTSDGTPEGTIRVSDVKPPGFKPFSTSYAGTLDDVHYFYANDRVHGTELWRTDGTRAGTRLVKDIWKGPR